MKRTYTVVFGALMFALLFPLGGSAQDRKADPDFVRARQLFFGAENVDPHSGRVKHDKVIFSWLTNASYAASLKGRVILLDSYVHRAETVPGRTPFVVEDLVVFVRKPSFSGMDTSITPTTRPSWLACLAFRSMPRRKRVWRCNRIR
jgi:hypothetical protein